MGFIYLLIIFPHLCCFQRQVFVTAQHAGDYARLGGAVGIFNFWTNSTIKTFLLHFNLREKGDEMLETLGFLYM